MLDIKKAPDDLAASRRQENLESKALMELVAACADVELPGDDEDDSMPGEVE